MSNVDNEEFGDSIINKAIEKYGIIPNIEPVEVDGKKYYEIKKPENLTPEQEAEWNIQLCVCNLWNAMFNYEELTGKEVGCE